MKRSEVYLNPKRKPKIAVIGLKGLPALGGAAVVGENIIRELVSKYNFTVLSISTYAGTLSGDNNVKQVVFKNIKNKRLNIFLYYIKSLIYCLFREKFDLVHLHHAESGFITFFLRLKYRVVTTFHGIFYTRTDLKFGFFANLLFKVSERLNLLFSNMVISVSETDIDEIRKYSRREISYIHNGIWIKEKEKKTSDYLLFSAARIYEVKGLHILIDAMKQLNKGIKLRVAGDLDQREEYREKILRMSEGVNVEFTGLVKNKSDLFDLLNNAKLFVFPSLYEAMSMMLLEAVSFKTPVIASNIPANRALFDDSEVTFFESENSNDLAQKIQYVLNHYDQALQKCVKAAGKLQDKYSWSVVAAQYDDIYKKLLM